MKFIKLILIFSFFNIFSMEKIKLRDGTEILLFENPREIYENLKELKKINYNLFVKLYKFCKTNKNSQEKIKIEDDEIKKYFKSDDLNFSLLKIILNSVIERKIFCCRSKYELIDPQYNDADDYPDCWS